MSDNAQAGDAPTDIPLKKKKVIKKKVKEATKAPEATEAPEAATDAPTSAPGSADAPPGVPVTSAAEITIPVVDDDVDKYMPTFNTLPKLTRFERARILGVREQQLATGAPPLVDTADCATTRDIVMKEFDARVIPIEIKRGLPNGKYEIRTLKDLIC